MPSGVVKSFDLIRKFGFIDADCGRSFFAHLRRVVPDFAGHRCLVAGEAVAFEIGRDLDSRPVADKVLAQRVPVDLSLYREISEVVSFNSKFGFLRRVCGEDDLFFHRDDILTTGVETLAPGVFVRHRVQPDPGGRMRAADVEIYETGFRPSAIDYEALVLPAEVGDIETHFLNAEELPLDVPEPMQLKASVSVLASENRKRTLLEIIAERRGGQR